MSKCIYCGREPYSYYEDWTHNVVCTEHKSHIHFCACCNRFIKTGKPIGNDRFLCEDCFDYQVNANNMQQHIDHVYDLLSEIGFTDSQKDHIDISLMTYEEMKNECSSEDEMFLGLHTGYSDIQDQRGRSGFHQAIRILEHLHYIVFEATLAHELLHAWQLQQNIQDFNQYHNTNASQYKERSEGFAQLGVAIIYKHFHKIGSSQIKELCVHMQKLNLDQNDDAYGKMYKKIYARVLAHDWESVIKEARLDELKKYV